MKRKEAKRIARALYILLPQWGYVVWSMDGANYGIQVWADSGFHRYTLLDTHQKVFRFIAKFGPRDEEL